MATNLSIYEGSDETSFQDCDVCTFQKATSEAVSYCTICSEYLCSVCANVHRSSKLTRNHKILMGFNLPFASTTSKPTSPIMFCEDHKTMTVDMYCEIHDVVICSACKMTSHTTCKLTNVSQETTHMQKDGSFNKTKTHLEDLKSKYDNMKAMRMKYKSSFKLQIENCREDMRQLRNEINETLDSIENTLSKEIQHADERITTSIEGHIAICDDILTQIREQLKTLTESEKAQDTQVMFVEMKRASNAEHKYADTMAKLQQYINQPEIHYKINDTLYDTVKQLQFAETVLVERHDNTADIAFGQPSQRSLLNMSISCKKDIPIAATNALGCTFMPKGQFVLCCGDKGLKCLDENFEIMSELGKCSFRVAAISDNEIIVTQGKQQILKVKIFPQMKVIKTMKMDRPCFGVDVYNDEIYVTCFDGDGGNGEVQVLNMNGKVKRRLDLINEKCMLTEPDFVAINNDGSKVFVSDRLCQTVTCLDTQGRVIYQYSDTDLKYPRGIFANCEGYLLVCGYHSNNVHIIGQDGDKKKILLSEVDGVRKPCCIAFRKSDGCLAVGMYDNENNKPLVIFKAE